MRKAHRSFPTFRLAPLAVAVVLAACSSARDSSTAPLTAHSELASTLEQTGYVRVCKAGGPSGTYWFNTTVQGGGLHMLNYGEGPLLSLNFTGTNICLNGGTYAPQGNDPSWTPGMTAQVTSTELVPEGMEVEKIEVWDFGVGPEALIQTITGSNTVTVTVTATSRYKIYFYNRVLPPPPPPGGEGCTPGYWKQSQHFDNWTGYTPSQTIASVFSGAATYNLGNYTLLQGLSFGGGSSVAEAAQNLLRAAIAGVLNAAHADVDYAMSAADIVSGVNAALASGDRGTILGLAGTIDTNNNKGCELN